MATVLRAVAARTFAAQQLQEELHGVFLFVEMMIHGLTTRADPPPSASQTDFSQQGRFDRHSVEASQVLRGVQPLDV